MPDLEPEEGASVESSSPTSLSVEPQVALPQYGDELHYTAPTTEPLKIESSPSDDETSSQDRTPLASPAASTGTDTGLPPTPPSNARDEDTAASFSPPPYADGVVSSLISKRSSLSTPVNQRSPPTPDPSPPRTSESLATSRPSIFAYPSSRAESFMTARENPSSTDVSNSRSLTPLADRLSTVNEERSSAVASEREDSDTTPTNAIQHTLDLNGDPHTPKSSSKAEGTPEKEWDAHLMRNVTVRKKRNPKFSPQRDQDPFGVASSPRSPSRPHRRIVSEGSPHTSTIEIFAKSIGWPTEVTSKTLDRPRSPALLQEKSVPPNKSQEQPQASNVTKTPNVSHEEARTNETKRHSGSSMASTVVEAMVIVTPPQRQRTLRHSGKNLAYRRDEDTSTDKSSRTHSNRSSLKSDDVPLHRLVHKRVGVSDRKKASSSQYPASEADRTISPSSTLRRELDSAAYTRAHQEAVRRVLQPAAMIMSRSNSVTRPLTGERSHHKRISSAPEPVKRTEARPTAARRLLELSPPHSPADTANTSDRWPHIDQTSPTAQDLQTALDLNKSLPRLPLKSSGSLRQEQKPLAEREEKEKDNFGLPLKEAFSPARGNPPSAQHPIQEHTRHSPQRGQDGVPRRGSISSRGRSEERGRSSASRDRTSPSQDLNASLSLDRVPTEELPRRSHEWRSLSGDDHHRVSFDTSTTPRSDEHALARHLYAATTPFSQFSDTPIEVSEATAVSIYPHNNHSLLVVQQVARSSTFPLMQREVPDDEHMPSSDPGASDMASQALLHEVDEKESTLPPLTQPTLNIEPSTPPMQLSLPVPGAVDSPLKNPRAAPEPPVIKFIPPTPAEELERELAPVHPGPPTRSDSHPQRSLSLIQRARRYSDNFIPFLAHASSGRGRHVSESHAHRKPRVPNVNDTDGSLHPFWRPRGFWEGFDDSDSESEGERLPQGGDTSDVEEEPLAQPEAAPKKLGVLGRRLTNGIKGSGGFLIGNSLGVERAGTNKRRPQINLPSSQTKRTTTRKQEAPKILIQRPTLPFARSGSPRIEKRGSRASMRSDRARRSSRKEAWRSGKRIPGVGLQVQYIGLSGVKERLRERRAEKRREGIRKSIGSRFFVEDGMKVT